VNASEYRRRALDVEAKFVLRDRQAKAALEALRRERDYVVQFGHGDVWKRLKAAVEEIEGMEL